MAKPVDVPYIICRHCGKSRQINAWCGSEECEERVSKAIEAENRWIMQQLHPSEAVKESER